MASSDKLSCGSGDGVKQIIVQLTYSYFNPRESNGTPFPLVFSDFLKVC